MLLAPIGCGAPVEAGEDGTIDTVVGTGEPGWLGGGYSGDAGAAQDARLNAPGALAFAADGTLFIADTDNNRIRSVNPDSGTINTVAGGGTRDWAQTSSATAAALPKVTDLAVDPYGHTLYIASMLENQVAAVDLAEGSLEILAGRDDGGAADLKPRQMNGVGGLWWPTGVDVGPSGTLYIADSGNGRIVAITPHQARDAGHPESDHVRVVAKVTAPSPAPSASSSRPDGSGAASGSGGASDGGDGSSSSGGDGGDSRAGPTTQTDFSPLGPIAAGKDGAVYFADATAGLSKIDPDDHTVTNTWDPRLPPHPEALAVEPEDGTVLAADAANNRVLAFVPGKPRPITLAGNGMHGFAGDDGPAEQAMLDSPGGIAVSPGGDLYIADTHNHRIRVVHGIRATIGTPPT
ncbi:hypothetical protein GCM10027570_13850 [Streptomonospora sediminis]